MRSIIAAIILPLALSSCAFIERNTVGLFDASTPTEAQVGSEAQDISTARENAAPDSSRAAGVSESNSSPRESGDRGTTSTDIEIVWEIPKTPVDSYLIRYGAARDDLSKEVKVDVSDLVRLDDPDHGFVYRYLLRGFAPNAPVFVTIAAVKEDQISAPSQVFEVGPS